MNLTWFVGSNNTKFGISVKFGPAPSNWTENEVWKYENEVSLQTPPIQIDLNMAERAEPKLQVLLQEFSYRGLLNFFLTVTLLNTIDRIENV